MKVVWSRHAVAQLAEIRAYIAKDKPVAAIQVAERIRRSVRQLSRHPRLGWRGILPGTRELIVPGAAFLVPYRIDEQTIEMIAVHHAAQRRQSDR